MAPQPPLSNIHICHLCSAQKIGPFRRTHSSELFVLRYPGLIVYRGINDCKLFSHIYSILTSKWNDGSNNCFDIDLLMYELRIFNGQSPDYGSTISGWI